MPEEISYGVEDGSGNRHFNDIPPMYTYEDLESKY